MSTEAVLFPGPQDRIKDVFSDVSLQVRGVMKTARTLFINGKFLAQRTTGVQRFAHGLIMALDENLGVEPDQKPPVLLLPPGAKRLRLKKIEQRECGLVPLLPTVWEQTCLPWAARNGVLLCLTGSAPVLGRVVIPTIHDAAVYLHPEAYSWKFVLWYRFLFLILTSKAPVNFTVSHSSAVDLERFLPGREFRIVPNSAEHILSHDADNSILDRSGLERGRYFLAVGSQNLTKNIDFLVKAYLESRLGPNIRLVLVGGRNVQVFSNTSANIDVPGLFCVGAISDRELRALYESALALVFPSVFEGFGIPPLEAMICGCPVLASNASSIPEVCGDAALYFDPRNVGTLVQALLTIVENLELRSELVSKGHSRSVQYSWSHSSDALMSELRALGLFVRN